MVLKKSTGINQFLPILISVLGGVSICIMIWMVTLPPGFISKWRIVFAGLSAFVFTLIYFKVITRVLKDRKQRLPLNFGLISIVAICLTALIYQHIIHRDNYFFPFSPKQVLVITSTADLVTFRPIECQFTTLYPKNFQVAQGRLISESWDSITLSTAGTQVSWTGWPGSNCTITVVTPEEDAMLITWSGKQETPAITSDVNELTFNYTFGVPFATKIIVLFITAFFVVAVISLSILGSEYLVQAYHEPEMNRKNFGKSSELWSHGVTGALLVLILGLSVNMPVNPIHLLLSRDSGVFLLIGKGLLTGGTPYLDYWDHKGPFIYIFNALGKFINPVGETGVMLLQVMVLLFTAWFLFKILKPRIGLNPTLASIAFFLYSLSRMDVLKNLVEVYALVFICAGIYFGLRAIENEKPAAWMAVGVFGAVAFLLRPNLIAVFIVLVILFLYRYHNNVKILVRGLMYAIVGVILVITPIFLYFLIRGALSDMIDQVFVYNFMYSTADKTNLLERFSNVSSPTFLVVVIGLICLVVLYGINNKTDIPRKTDLLLRILIPTFILEFIFSEISGFHFPQYSMTLALIVSMLLGYLLLKITNPLPIKTETSQLQRIRINQAMLFITIIFIGCTAAMIRNREPIQNLKTLDEESKKWADTRPTLLMWGAEAVVNYMLNKPAPTRYVYQLPLMNDRYCTNEKGEELFNDIKENLPIIIDASESSPWMPALDPIRRGETIAKKSYIGNLNCLEDFFQFFEAHYKEVYTIQRYNWIVYSPQ